MKVDIITLFPDIFDFYLSKSILQKAQDKKIIKIKAHNLRNFTLDKHKVVDDKAFGGGRGMVLKIEALYRAIQFLKSKNKKQKTKVVLFTPRGKKFNQKIATEWSKLDELILICGRYEGVDERINKIVDEKVSIGDFVMMGGDLAGLIVIESVARLLPGVVGNSESLIEERIDEKGGFIEYPQYTRPEIFETKDGKKLRTPRVLMSGNHKKIEEWRKKHSKVIE